MILEPAPQLAGATWPEVAHARPLVLVPVGSLEQHGPGLPLVTDALVATRVTQAAAQRLAATGVAVTVAPTQHYGASGEHEGFAGTISIGTEALQMLLVEIGRSALRWASGLIFVNGHGGNLEALAAAVRLLRSEGRAVGWTTCSAPGMDAHAGRSETSLLLALAPELVRVDALAPGNTSPLTELLPRLRAEGVLAVSPSGVLGDPTTADEAHGRRLMAAMVDRLVGELGEVDVDDLGRLREAGVGV